jgi:hypothetical protein
MESATTCREVGGTGSERTVRASGRARAYSLSPSPGRRTQFRLRRNWRRRANPPTQAGSRVNYLEVQQLFEGVKVAVGVQECMTLA